MSTATGKILGMIAAKVVEKYDPLVIGVFEDDESGTAAGMIKDILEKKYEVRLSGRISEPDVEIPRAVIRETRRAGAQDSSAMVKGIGLTLRKDSSYPNVVILQMAAEKAGDMKKMLEAIRPGIVVFVAGGNCMEEGTGKKMKRAIGEKSVLMRSLKKDNHVIFCADDETIGAIAQKSRCSKITYGMGEEAKVRGKIFRENDVHDRQGNSFKISYRGTIVPFHFSSGAGEKEVCAALAATAVGIRMGFNLVEISEALRR